MPIPLAQNALTTLKAVKTELKMYMVVNVGEEQLINTGDSLKYNLRNKNVVPESITQVTETVSSTVTDITNLVNVYDYENGTITFTGARTGTIKVSGYDYLKFDNTQDDYITRKINSYSAFIEKELGRKLGLATYTEENYIGNNRQFLILNQWPVVEVSEINYYNNGQKSLLQPNLYMLPNNCKDRGMVYKEDGWISDSYLIGYVGEPLAPKMNWLVTYTAGYVLPKDETAENQRTLPWDIEDLCLQFVAEEKNRQGSQGLKAFEIHDVKWQWSDTLRDTYNRVIDRYKRYIV